jgi:hypothetical protein
MLDFSLLIRMFKINLKIYNKYTEISPADSNLVSADFYYCLRHPYMAAL